MKYSRDAAEVVTLVDGMATLNHSGLISGSEIVRDAATGTVYTRGDDYSIGYLPGTIDANADGDIGDDDVLGVEYRWKPDG